MSDATQLKPTPEHFKAAIDGLFRGAFRLPVRWNRALSVRDLGRGKDAPDDSLVAAQLAEGKKERDLHVARYTLTQAGERAAQNFCFGHRHVVSIDSSTPPAAANGFMESTVNYTYRIEDEPVWAKTPEVVAAFPKLAKETSGTAKDKMVLALTGVGWTVPN